MTPARESLPQWYLSRMREPDLDHPDEVRMFGWAVGGLLIFLVIAAGIIFGVRSCIRSEVRECLSDGGTPASSADEIPFEFLP